LRAEIEQYINGRLSGLQEEIARLQSQINEAFTRVTERLQIDAETDAPVAVAIAEHLRTARNAGIEAAASESTRARASSDIAILKAAIDDIDGQRSQSDILNALVNRAANFAPHVAFFVIKNDRATGWKARGLEGTVGDQSVREISLPLTSDTLLSEVARTRTTWSGAPGTHAEDHLIHGHFSEEPPQRIIAIPLVARDKAVAVLYADSAGQDSDAVGLEALEMLVRVAGMAVELLAVKRPAPVETRSATPSVASSQTPAMQPTPTHTPEAARDASAPFTRDEPAPQPYTGAPQAETVDVESPEVMPSVAATPVAAEEEGTGSASSSSSAIPAFAEPSQDATPQQTSPAAAPLGTARRFGADTELPVEVSDADRRYHNDARRFARLLVSEIKLYNEQKVKDGRAEGNLYNRLREDIDRSRQMYDKRVAPEVAGRFDYFHYELVNTLAEGDPDKLGADYPGATVSA
jgi:hypothetical protein